MARTSNSSRTHLRNEKGFAMLILTRKFDESIVIRDEVVISVQLIRGNIVKLGIQAPAEVPILRSEIHTPEPAEGSKPDDLYTSKERA